jgi:putative inorganic carbon (HCO3(-)) transporter
MSFASQLEERYTALGMDGVDARWGATMASSWFGRAWAAVVGGISGVVGSRATIGTWLQRAGFAIAVLLFVILPHPRFVNDKLELAFIVAAGWGLRLLGTLLAGRERYRPSAIDGIVLLYFAMHLVASFSSHYLKESLFGLGKNLVYLIAYFLFVWSLQAGTETGSARRTVIILTGVIAAGTAVALYGLWQYKIGVAPLATWEDPSIEDKTTRIYSTLNNPNLLAGYLIPLIPLSLGLTMASWYSRAKYGAKALLPFVIFLGCTGAIFMATILTGSRGAWIALGLEAAAFAAVAASWVWRKRPGLRWLVIAAVLAMPLLAVAALHFHLLPAKYETRLMSIFAGAEHSSNAYRMNVYRASFNMLKDNWWLGIGSGNKTFVLVYGLYMKSGFDALGTYCVPLEIAVETGILGLGAFCWMLVALSARAHRRFWNGVNPAHKWLALAAIVAIIGMMAHGLVDTVFFRPQVHFIFWLCVAIIVALPDESKQAGTSA